VVSAARFQTEGLDHVAIAVRDLDRSERFYREVLGLERAYDEWSVPRVMAAGGSGLALFPSDEAADADPAAEPAIRVRHIAFRVDRANFDAAQQVLADDGVEFELSDHGISHSVYFRDPDGHELELTTYDV
jgi:catechol 2,3-dioxygenase-like lactoylglutathione lyase family enzyme